MPNLSVLEEVKDLRTVWPHEAADFTPWLAEDDNISLLGDALGLEISVDETEASVGDFNVDITATEIGTSKKIIIENQLEDTDHDHLGKVITYASGKDAQIMIWVVKHARSEHRAAIEWLNNHTDDETAFFLCEIKLYKIGDSEPAVKFEVIEQPNDWAKEAKTTKSTTPTQQARLEYWNAMNDYVFANKAFSKEFNKRKATTDHWMNFAIGTSACYITISQIVKRNSLVVELHIDNDKALFQSLLSHKTTIEQDIGLALEWKELPNKKASRILVEQSFNLADKANRQSQFDWIMDTAIKFKKAFKKHL